MFKYTKILKRFFSFDTKRHIKGQKRTANFIFNQSSLPSPLHIIIHEVKGILPRKVSSIRRTLRYNHHVLQNSCFTVSYLKLMNGGPGRWSSWLGTSPGFIDGKIFYGDISISLPISLSGDQDTKSQIHCLEKYSFSRGLGIFLNILAWYISIAHKGDDHSMKSSPV